MNFQVNRIYTYLNQKTNQKEIWDKISPLIIYSVIADMAENIGQEQDDVVEEEDHTDFLHEARIVQQRIINTYFHT